jgi:hypothetical protein
MEKTLVQEEQHVEMNWSDIGQLGDLQLALAGGGIGETVL